MIDIREGGERGVTRMAGWTAGTAFLSAITTIRRDMGFGPLRVINEDRVAPGRRFSDPRPPRHGDSHLGAGRCAGAPRQPRQRGRDPARANCRRCGPAPASGTASSTLRPRSRCTSCRSGSFRNGQGLTPGYAAAGIRSARAGRTTAAARFARRAGRLAGDRPGRRSVGRAEPAIQAVCCASAGGGPAGLAAGGAWRRCVWARRSCRPATLR